MFLVASAAIFLIIFSDLNIFGDIVKTGKYRPGAESRPGVIPPDEVHDSFASFVESLFNGQIKA